MAVERCRAGSHWTACGGEVLANLERGPATLGPMRRLFAVPACAVYAENDGASLEAALYVANLLFMTGHGRLPLLLESEVLNSEGALSPPEVCQSLLVLGTPVSSRAAAALLRPQPALAYEPPVQVDESGSGLVLGGCHWAGPGLAALALLPWWPPAGASATKRSPQRLALLAIGSSPQAATEAVALLATPTIPPMTRQPFTHLLPDYVVLDVAQTRARGAGGFLAAGFWGHRWQHEPRAAWERSCHSAALAEEGGLRTRDEL
uniref:Uncharacterized protein n=1 Tax=Pyrodinium bahamense TaxID=73915 RepID=A0A7S0AD90_9DINO|mmetsp:Transcript_30926/g.85278  ORF Transcript_30926/g.85278 Transcript_30926/m.85278 type:complete len:263 (+) Transcript_30926:3-791(+)